MAAADGRTRSRPTDVEDCRAEVGILAEQLYPALWRGWVESNSTTRGTVFYRLTSAGSLALDGKPISIGRLPRRSADAEELYLHSFNEAYLALRNAAESASEIGYVSMSCSPTTYRAVAARRPPCPSLNPAATAAQ